MISSVICISDRYIDSNSFSLQHKHIELFIEGSLYSIIICDKDYTFIRKIEGQELANIIGDSIKKGRRYSTNSITGCKDFYYIAKW